MEGPHRLGEGGTSRLLLWRVGLPWYLPVLTIPAEARWAALRSASSTLPSASRGRRGERDPRAHAALLDECGHQRGRQVGSALMLAEQRTNKDITAENRSFLICSSCLVKGYSLLLAYPSNPRR